MSQSQISADFSNIAVAEMEHPLTVKDAAKFLGVSPQTVYLWVERKQIPHLRVMGRMATGFLHSSGTLEGKKWCFGVCDPLQML